MNDSVVLIHAKVGDEQYSFLGIGVLLTGDIIVTCAHVVKKHYSGIDELSSLFVSIPSNDELGYLSLNNAHVIDKMDVFFASFNCDLPDDLNRACIPSTETRPLLGVIHTYLERNNSRHYTDIICTISEDLDPVQKSLVRISPKILKSYWVSSGCSGSPIFAKGGQQVLAIVRRSELNDEGDPSQEIKEGFAIVTSAWKDEYDKFYRFLQVERGMTSWNRDRHEINSPIPASEFITSPDATYTTPKKE